MKCKFDPSSFECQRCTEPCEERDKQKGQITDRCKYGAGWFDENSLLCQDCDMVNCPFVNRDEYRFCPFNKWTHNPELCKFCYYRQKPWDPGIVCHNKHEFYDQKLCKECKDECEFFAMAKRIHYCPFTIRKI